MIKTTIVYRIINNKLLKIITDEWDYYGGSTISSSRTVEINEKDIHKIKGIPKKVLGEYFEKTKRRK